MIRLNKTRADFAEKFGGLDKLGVQFNSGAPDFFNAYQAAVTTTTGMATEAAARLSGATLKRTPPATAIASRPANC